MKKIKCHRYTLKLMLSMTLVFFPIISFAQNDTIIFKNKDRVIGEIKDLTKGVLTVETSYSDSDFKIEWLNIKQIISDRNFLITLSNGERLNSTFIANPKDSAQVTINNNGKEVQLALAEVTFIKTAAKDNFLSRFKASLSVGYNFTKSQNLSQFTVRSTMEYTANNWSLSGAYNSVRSKQTNVEELQRSDGNITFKDYLKKNWYALASADFLSNEEQKLKLRTTLKGGIGKYFVYTNKKYFGAGTGLAWNNERFNDSLQTNRNSLEAFVGLELNLFDFEDISLLSKVTAYPSLTESNRIRTDFSTDFKYDLPLDFFLKLGITYNYDSKPVEGASKDDYIIQTTFGWELD
ncbi:putative salt-induced outer membrane protein YdiY [Flavobacterium sp. AG291]|nr:putative salt-induced outer membrane protein YdiY [Flavobacterium sp. AG291]